MIPDKNNRIRVAANFDGEVELCCQVGDIVEAGFCLVEVEGEGQIERLCAKTRSRVVQVCVAQDAEVKQYELLVIVEGLPED